MTAEILVRQRQYECHPLNHATASVVLVAVSFAADTSARSPNLRGRGRLLFLHVLLPEVLPLLAGSDDAPA